MMLQLELQTEVREPVEREDKTAANQLLWPGNTSDFLHMVPLYMFWINPSPPPPPKQKSTGASFIALLAITKERRIVIFVTFGLIISINIFLRAILAPATHYPSAFCTLMPTQVNHEENFRNEIVWI